jgi:signal transduction histidine kinase
LTLSRGLAAQADFAGSEMAADIANLLKQTMGEARDLARGLGPIRLPAVGLEAALEGLALNVRHLHEVTCTFDRDAVFPRLKEDVEAHIFRIAQQAVDNAVTHGATNTIEIRLSHEDGRGVLSIRDDGVGLPPKGLGSGGTGLHGMAYRAQLIGGVLDVCGLQPRGTAVKCLFPLIRGPETHETS